MDIHSYQIHNVLNVYRRQLSQGKAAAPTPQQSDFKAELDRVSLNQADQRDSVIERVSSNILDRIRNYGETTPGPESPTPEARLSENTHPPATDRSKQFFFNTLVQENRKVTHAMPVNDSIALMNHMAELAKKKDGADSESDDT